MIVGHFSVGIPNLLKCILIDFLDLISDVSVVIAHISYISYLCLKHMLAITFFFSKQCSATVRGVVFEVLV